jgi:hypothetical protein
MGVITHARPLTFGTYPSDSLQPELGPVDPTSHFASHLGPGPLADTMVRVPHGSWQDDAARVVRDYRMPVRQWSIVGSVRPLHGPGQQRSHASAGQPDRPEGEDQLGPTTSHLGPCRRRMFRRTLRKNQMCSTNSLRLRRRHHRLLGIHRRRHSDRWAAILRGSGPVSGPVAGRA